MARNRSRRRRLNPGAHDMPCPDRMAFVSALVASRHATRSSGSHLCRHCGCWHLGPQPALDAAEALFAQALS